MCLKHFETVVWNYRCRYDNVRLKCVDCM